MQNLFTAAFGELSDQFIPRVKISDKIIRDFSQQNPPNQVFIITGVRGSGKTVLLSSFVSYFEVQEDWIVINLNPDGDLLQDFANDLYENNSMAEIFRSLKTSPSDFGILPEIAIARMLKKTQEKNKKVLITIDDIKNTKNAERFISEFQIFLRQDLPVYLLMAGLPENVDLLQNNDILTFLYRAPKMFLGPLNLSYISDIYKKNTAITSIVFPNCPFRISAVT